MDVEPPAPPAPSSARDRLLAAALRLIRERGYAATSVDELCRAAGVTKGAFFHHFASKEALGVAAAEHWDTSTASFFAAAPYHAAPTPRARVLGYIDFRDSLLGEDIAECTCVAGTLVQEVWDSHPAVRDACGAAIGNHAAALEADIAAARPEGADWTAASLALFTQTVLQGAFVVAKALGGEAGGMAVARGQVAHLRRYLEMVLREDEA
jgi:TetR/AcrR family transcriptional repressor of nem operon